MATAHRPDWMPRGAPPCKYGSDCYQKSSEHRARFAHPPGGLDGAAIVIADSSDEDVDGCVVVNEGGAGQGSKRRRVDAGDDDASVALARELQRKEDEAYTRQPQRAEDEASHKARQLQRKPDKHCCRASALIGNGGSAAPSHPTFKADGLGFWLLHTQGIEREANSPEFVVRLKDVVVGDIKWAILSNYLWDMHWLVEDIPKLKEIPKFMLLGYESGIRVVIMTANNIFSDNYHMTDALWSQDFPWKHCDSPSRSDFEDTLTQYLEEAQWSGAKARGQHISVKTLRKCDFSSARVVLIASVPGRHTGDDLDKWGQMALRKALLHENFDEQAKLVCQFTSMGGLKKQAGSDFFTSLLQSLHSGNNRIIPLTDARRNETCVVWPTREEVRTSTQGYEMGDSIPGRNENVWEGDAKKLLQSLYCRWSAPPSDSRAEIEKDPWGRGHAMPHVKTFLRHVGNDIAWLFLSSFNFSGAAFGRLQTKGKQLHILSYEMGVLLVPSLLPTAADCAAGFFSCTETFAACAGNRVVEKEGNILEQGTGRLGGSKLQMFACSYLCKRQQELGSGKLPLPLPYALSPCRYGPMDEPWAVDVELRSRDSKGRSKIKVDRQVLLVGHEGC